MSDEDLNRIKTHQEIERLLNLICFEISRPFVIIFTRELFFFASHVLEGERVGGKSP